MESKTNTAHDGLSTASAKSKFTILVEEEEGIRRLWTEFYQEKGLANRGI